MATTRAATGGTDAEVAERSLTLVAPSLRDPRLHLAGILITIQVLGQVSFHFDLSITQILASVVAAAVLEVGIVLARRRALAWPASAMLTGNGVALILRVPGTEHGDWWSTRGWWMFAAVGGGSLLSKYVIRWRGRHLFNPSNLGLVVGVLVLGTSRVDLQDLWWGPLSTGLVLTLLLIAIGAAMITSRLGQLPTAAAFWVVFSAGTALLGALGHCISARWHVGPLCGHSYWWVVVTSPEVLIFTFFMVTDPKTTPGGVGRRVAFGAMVGVFATLLVAPQTTEVHTKLAILAALVVACALRFALEAMVPHHADARSAGAWFVARPVRPLVAIALLLAAAAAVPVVESSAQPVALAAIRGRPHLVDLADVPTVVIDGSARRIDPPVDDAQARRLARDLLEDLAIERLAAGRADGRLARTAATDDRLDDLLALVKQGRREIPQRDITHMTVLSTRTSPQAPPTIQMRVRGTTAGTGDRYTATFDLALAGRFALIARSTSSLGGRPTTTRPATGLEAPIPPSEVQAPAALLRGLHFTDVTDRAGLDAPQSKGRPPAEGFVGGVAVEDIDGDGLTDIYQTRVGLPNRLLRNQGDGTFVDVAGDVGLDTDGKDGDSAPVWADVDGDRDLDLLVTSAYGGRTLLYLNQDGRFVEEGAARGLTDEAIGDGPAMSFGADMGDLDGDGDLDLVVGQWSYLIPNADEDVAPEKQGSFCNFTDEDRGSLVGQRPTGRTRVYLNDGEGRFRDATTDLGFDLDKVAGFQPSLVDYDEDGRTDVLLTGDYCTSRLFHNEGDGRFTDATAKAGVASDENGMGSAVADLDGDGHLDWIVTSIAYLTKSGGCELSVLGGCSGNRVYRGKGDGTFTDATDSFGMREGGWGWGVVAADFNDDGRVDVAQTNGYVEEGNFAYAKHYATDPMAFWLNPGRRPLLRVSKQVDLDAPDDGKALVPLDYDRDGDLDLLVNNTRTGLRLYRNDLRDGGAWVGVRLDDPTSANHRGIGAVLRVDAGGREQMALVRAAGSYQSGVEATARVGLGSVPGRTVHATITWPGGGAPQEVDLPVDRVTTVARST